MLGEHTSIAARQPPQQEQRVAHERGTSASSFAIVRLHVTSGYSCIRIHVRGERGSRLQATFRVWKVRGANITSSEAERVVYHAGIDTTPWFVDVVAADRVETGRRPGGGMVVVDCGIVGLWVRRGGSRQASAWASATRQ